MILFIHNDPQRLIKKGTSLATLPLTLNAVGIVLTPSFDELEGSAMSSVPDAILFLATALRGLNSRFMTVVVPPIQFSGKDPVKSANVSGSFL